MDKDYADFKPKSDTLFDNFMQSVNRKYKEDVVTLPENTDRSRWTTGPAIVNAWYSPTRNTITFPAGILQPPFYDKGASKASNYGGIGFVIGHELTHGFDDQGSQYGADGNKANWWSESSRENFDKNAQCIIDQYDSYTWDLAKDSNGNAMHV